MKGIDLNRFVDAVQRENLAVRGVRVFRHGELVGSYQPEPERRQNQYSGTKSFTSTAVGFALQERLFSLEDPVLEHFGGDAPQNPSENLKKMKLFHLITMSMGFEHPMLMGDMRPKMAEKDWVKYVLSAEVVREPGTAFLYNNAGPYLLGMLIQRKTGLLLSEYLRPRLFEPLGIGMPVYEKDPLGNDFGAGGMQITVSEFAKLGLLYLQKGVWNGKRLLDESWIRAASSPQIRTGEGDDEVGRYYGYQFWIMPDGVFRADGKYGQYCIVVPGKDAVVAINSMQYGGEQQILRLAVRTILPQL